MTQQPQPQNSAMETLAFVLTLERMARSTVNTVAGNAHEKFKTAEGLYGQRATYSPRPNGEPFPPRNERVAEIGSELLADVVSSWAAWLDLVATKEFGNWQQTARADVVDPETGDVIIEGAPIPLLVQLEKHLKEMQMFMDKLPMLISTKKWTEEHDGIWRSEPEFTSDAVDIPQRVVLYDATEHHPAQVDQYPKPTLLGVWETIHLSSAFQPTRVAEMQNKLDRMSAAVKKALYEANSVKVSRQNAGTKLMRFIFG